MRSVLLAIDSIPSSYLGQPIVHLHFVTKFKSWTLGFSLRVPNRPKRDLHYTTVDTSEDKETPGRGGSPAAEGGASASDELGVSVGVGDSRLPPLTEPPAHHTTLGPHGISIPGVTNRAGDRAIFSCGTSCGSGSADQPNYHGDLALAPRSPIGA